jgi:hypothetical protein
MVPEKCSPVCQPLELRSIARDESGSGIAARHASQFGKQGLNVKNRPLTDIEQPLTPRNLINLAHILPKQSQDVDLHLVETFNEVVHLTVYAHPDPMHPFEQLENPA